MWVISLRWMRPCPLYTPPVATTDWMAQWGLRTGSGRSATPTQSRKVGQTWSFRGSKSRNKVSVGEPAEGSLPRVTDARGAVPGAPPPTSSTLWIFALVASASVEAFRASAPAPAGELSPEALSIRLYSDVRGFAINIKTFNNGSLGSGIDEERSEMR